MTSDTTQMLLESAQRVFDQNFGDAARRRAEAGEWLADGWQAIEEFGATLVLLSEKDGGFGLPARDGFALVRLAAAAGVPMPIAEAMLANWLLARAGLGTMAGPLTVAPVERGDKLTLAREGEGWRLTGLARQVPWGREAGLAVIAQAEDGWHVASVDRGAAEVVSGRNMADHPRDDLRFDIIVAADRVSRLPEPLDGDAILLGGAALRAAAIAGALDRTVALTVDYANDRVQFARPIGKFQAVQQNVARLAGEAAAAAGAANLAAAGFQDDLARLPIAVAKARAGEAAGIAAGIAHQVIGAIGFTREHALNAFTRPIWSWRDEFGREAYWNAQVGAAAIGAGPRGVWPLITGL